MCFIKQWLVFWLCDHDVLLQIQKITNKRPVFPDAPIQPLQPHIMYNCTSQRINSRISNNSCSYFRDGNLFGNIRDARNSVLLAVTNKISMQKYKRQSCTIVDCQVFQSYFLIDCTTTAEQLFKAAMFARVSSRWLQPLITLKTICVCFLSCKSLSLYCGGPIHQWFSKKLKCKTCFVADDFSCSCKHTLYWKNIQAADVWYGQG